jgi:signal transduction histidine kinase/CheY-like chemotaxis protein
MDQNQDGLTAGRNHSPEIRAAQVRLLYEQLPSALTATIVNAGILSVVLWRATSSSLLAGWLTFVFLLALGRYRLFRIYFRDPANSAGDVRWGRYCIYGVLANGALWGFAGFFFFTPQSYFHQIFLAFVLAGMASGGVVTLSSVRGAYPAFLLPALLPYAVRQASVGDGTHFAMTGMTLLYIAMMWIISNRVYATVSESLRLRFANIDLVGDLTRAKARQEMDNAALEQRVRERTEELAKSEEALRNADRRKDEFLAMLAHEFRNPLAPIRNVVELMKKPGVPNSTVNWGREVIDRQIEHLNRLVDDLLDISRIVQGKISLHETVLDITAVVHQGVEASRPLIEARGHELSVRMSHQPVWVRGDAVRLTQVIANLLDNAAKYTDAGGRIQLSIDTSPYSVTLRVRDNGIGIPASVLPHIFDLFTQADHSIARTQSGLGIGLTLVKRIVEMHGGRIEVHSDGPGCGSEFLVHLSREVSSQEQPQATAPIPAASAQTPLRVLVVDDNHDTAESLALLLQLEGHDVTVAFDGVSALAEAARFQPQAVLLDLGMPGMDGYDVVRELRAREATKSAVILALSGYGQPDDKARAQAAGFTGHLTKPVEPATLLAALKDRADGT